MDDTAVNSSTYDKGIIALLVIDPYNDFISGAVCTKQTARRPEGPLARALCKLHRRLAGSGSLRAHRHELGDAVAQRVKSF